MLNAPVKPLKGYWARAYDDFFGMRTLLYLLALELVTGFITHWTVNDMNEALETGMGVSVIISLLRAWRTGQPDKRNNGK